MRGGINAATISGWMAKISLPAGRAGSKQPRGMILTYHRRLLPPVSLVTSFPIKSLSSRLDKDGRDVARTWRQVAARVDAATFERMQTCIIIAIDAGARRLWEGATLGSNEGGSPADNERVDMRHHHALPRWAYGWLPATSPLKARLQRRTYFDTGRRITFLPLEGVADGRHSLGDA